MTDLRIALLKQELIENKRAEDALNELFHQEQKEAKNLIIIESQDDYHRTGIERSRILYESIVKRLQELDTVKDFGGFNTQSIGYPEPGKWLWKKSLLATGLAVFLGMVAAFFVAIRSSLRDKRFRNLQEIKDCLGKPILGQIPAARPTRSSSAPLDPCLRTYHEPNSPEAEAYRSVRPALLLLPEAGKHVLVQVTAPERGAGTSTLAANLAISLAQVGKSVLLVDADFHHPRLHALFGLTNERGFSSLLAGQSTIRELTHDGPVQGLSLLPSGPVSPDLADIVGSSRLQEVLHTLRRDYEYVLLDSTSLLEPASSAFIGSQVDGVVLNLHNTKNCRPCAVRAREILDLHRAKLVGVVVTKTEGMNW